MMPKVTRYNNTKMCSFKWTSCVVSSNRQNPNNDCKMVVPLCSRNLIEKLRRCEASGWSFRGLQEYPTRLGDLRNRYYRVENVQ